MENKRTCLYDKHVALGAHISPFRRPWINKLCGIIFPIGLFFYIRIWRFRIRLAKDLECVVKTNNDICRIIESQKNL